MHGERIKCQGRRKIREEMKGAKFRRKIKVLRAKNRRCKWC